MIGSEGGRRLPTPLLWVMLLLPIVIFYALVAAFNTRLPTEDDFRGLFAFVLRWHSLPDVAHRLLLIVSFQYNEYKMPLPYSLIGLNLALTHQISIPFWIWVGNLLALTMLVPLWLTCAPDASLRDRLLYFVPVVWIVMSLGYAETVDFALSGLQVILVMTLSLMSLFLITREEVRLNYLGCAFALLACATYANAFMLAPIGIPVLWRAGHKAVLSVWVSTFALALAAFVYRYQFLPHTGPHLVEGILFFFTLMGTTFGFHGIYQGALFCGGALGVCVVYFALKRADRVQAFAFWAAVWLLLGFVLTAYGRGSYGLAAALQSRYKIYGDLLLALMYLQGLALWRRGRLPWLERRTFLRVAIACAVLFGLYSDALGWYRLHGRRIDVTYGTARYVATHGTASPMVYPMNSPEFQHRPDVEAEARALLTEMIADGLYHLPARFQAAGTEH